MRTLLLLIALCLTSPIPSAETEIPVAVTTANGSRVVGMLQTRAAMFRKNDGGQTPVLWMTIKSITLGERLDPNVENEALIAINDLQSNSFDKRSAAEATLRKLGHAAARPLRAAASGTDAETAARAKALLAELTGQNAADRSSDYVVFSDDKTASGELSLTDFVIRTRYGVFSFGAQTLISIETVKPQAVPLEKLASLKDGAAPIIVSPPEQTQKTEAARWDPVQDAAQGREVPDNDGAMRHISGDAASVKRTWVALQRGDPVDDAFAESGLLLRSSAKGSRVEVDDAPEHQVFGGSGGKALVAANADLEIDFIVPGTFSAAERDGRTGGVTQLGAFVKTAGAGTVGLAVYDRAGRQLAQITNKTDGNVVAGGARRDEFLGVRSNVPIARARFYRIDAAKVKDIVLDDLVFDRVIDVERDPRTCRVWLSSGEKIAGALTGGAADASAPEAALKVRPEFADPKSEAVPLPLTEIDRFEPPQFGDGQQQQEKPERTWRGTPHGVLLQNGDTFRARLLKLDEKEVVFGLAGGVEMKLPRDLLRKIELQPQEAAPGTPYAPVSVAEAEKPGIELRKKRADPDPKKPDAKPDAKNTTPRMDDVEIVSADPEKGELTVRDEQGDFDIGFNLASTFIFKPNAEAGKPNAKFRDWTLQLREGSRFDCFIVSISEKIIEVEMAGGHVTLPAHVVEFLQRQKR